MKSNPITVIVYDCETDTELGSVQALRCDHHKNRGPCDNVPIKIGRRLFNIEIDSSTDLDADDEGEILVCAIDPSIDDDNRKFAIKAGLLKLA